jgi:hypothetical protein
MNLAIHARQLATQINTGLKRWMFAPGGIHTLTPSADQGSVEITSAAWRTRSWQHRVLDRVARALRWAL